MITRKAAAALAAGCPMIVRPASETPYSALALAELADRAGIPAGIFSVITGPAEPIVATLQASPIVRAVSFTGSTEIGRRLLEGGAATIKRMSMELGGHAPMIIFPEVDLDDAVAGAIAAKFQTTGQDCLAANRIYVHASIYDAFVHKFAAGVRALEVGNGLDDGVEIGPLMHQRAVAKCEAHVADAVAWGGRILAGGGRHPLGGNFFAPTVIADATDAMLIASEETFGPVAAVFRFEHEDEVVARANDTIYGLAAYVWSNDLNRVARLTAALEYGMVAVNCVKMTGAPIPFGGIKQSGQGREGARHGLEEFTELKYVCIQIAEAA
jgi:aspartate-semialdehyde dehydrogenase